MTTAPATGSPSPRRGRTVLHDAPDPGDLGPACISTGRIRAAPAQSPGAAVVGPTTSADVQALVTSLESAVHVVFTPMPDLVARLETGGPVPVLHLDRDSPPEDHRWALWEVLRFLALGLAATDAAVAVPRLRLVRD